MRNMLFSLFAVLLLPLIFAEATDEDSLLTDEDTIIDPGVNFDIPAEATAWPDGREKHFCSCRLEEDNRNAACWDRPFYYLIKVQNWGGNIPHEVMVSDNLSPYVDYAPGTTEMATRFDQNGNGTDWTLIPDGTEGAFPLSGEGYKIADTMTPCDFAMWTCADTRLIRFKVRPKPGLPHGVVISNIARIKEAESSWEYLTNEGIELKLMQGACRSLADCPEPPKSECGGDIPDDDTISDDDTVTTDEAATDDTTIPDTDTKKDDGCGCSLVF